MMIRKESQPGENKIKITLGLRKSMPLYLISQKAPSKTFYAYP